MTEIKPHVLRRAFKEFFDDWHGPVFGSPEYLKMMEDRHNKAREDFADRMMTFLGTNTTVEPIDDAQRKAALDWVLSHMVEDVIHDYPEEYKTNVDILRAALSSPSTPTK